MVTARVESIDWFYDVESEGNILSSTAIIEVKYSMSGDEIIYSLVFASLRHPEALRRVMMNGPIVLLDGLIDKPHLEGCIHRFVEGQAGYSEQELYDIFGAAMKNENDINMIAEFYRIMHS